MQTIASNTLRRHATTSGSSSSRRLHDSSVRRASIMMPSMSPMMTEGKITRWLKKEGEAFSAGDILLEIESEVATIGVEANNDGIMGKILLPNGSANVPVEQIIAWVAKDKAELTKMQKNLTLTQPPRPAHRRPAPLTPMSASSGMSAFFSGGPLTPRAAPFSPRNASSPFQAIPNSPRAQRPSTRHPEHPLSPSVHRTFFDAPNAQPSLEMLARGMATAGDMHARSRVPLPADPPTPTSAPADPGDELMDGHSVRRVFLTNFSQGSLRVRTPTTSFATSFPIPSSPRHASACTSTYFDGIL